MSQPDVLFVYGTLMFPEVTGKLLGREVSGRPAVLEGFRRHALRGRTYPGIVPAEGHRVEGLALEDLSPAELDRLDDFEGDEYARQAVTLRAAANLRLQAMAYVITPDRKDLLEPDDWDPARFRQCHLATYLQW